MKKNVKTTKIDKLVKVIEFHLILMGYLKWGYNFIAHLGALIVHVMYLLMCFNYFLLWNNWGCI